MRSRTTRRPRGRLRALAVAGAALALVVGVAAAPAQALAPTTIDANAWGVNGRVRAILETPSAVYIGGQFTAVVSPTGATMARNNIAALDPATGAPLPFNPGVDQQVIDLSISPDGQTLYAAGDFKTAAGVARGRAAAFDATSGALKPFDPKANLTIEAIQASATGVYIGGQFTKLTSVPRNFLAEVNASTGAVLPAFTATTDAKVHDIVLGAAGTKLFVGGKFAAVSGLSGQGKLVALNPATGGLLPWQDHPSAEIFNLTTSDGQVFAAGGGSGGHAYGFDIGTGRQLWTSLSNGDIHAVTLQNGVLYVGGHFTVYNGVDASHIAAISPTTGRRITWGVNVNSKLGIWAVGAFAGHLSIGGDFTRINGKARQHYARFIEAVDTLAPTVPGKPSAVAQGSTAAVLTWGASTDNTVEDIIYSVYRDGGGTAVGQMTSSSTTTVSFTDTGLAPGSTHTWTVRASDGVNTSAPSPVSDPLTLADPGFPVLTSMVMRDVNTDGKVDRVVATFSEPVTCTAPCLTPWTLPNVPSAGHLSSVAASGDSVTLTIAQGGGAPDTAVGSFTVALAASANGVVGGDGGQARFSATAPADGAGPVPTDITSTNGPTPNVMEPGDTFTATFSEPIDPASVHQGNVKEFDTGPTGDDQLIIVGLSGGASIDLGSNDYVTQDMGTIVFQDSTLTLLSGNTKIRSTIVGACTGTACGATGPGAVATITFVPEAVLTDLAGNGAVGSHTETEAPY